MRLPGRAPRNVGDLSQAQHDRLTEGDRSVWDEDRRGRPLSQRSQRRRDAAERREDRQSARPRLSPWRTR